MDMIGAALRGMGIDPSAVVTQAKQIGEHFNRLVETQDATLALLHQIAADQRQIMVTMGLAPLAPELTQLAAVESQRLIEAHGGGVAFDVVS